MNGKAVSEGTHANSRWVLLQEDLARYCRGNEGMAEKRAEKERERDWVPEESRLQLLEMKEWERFDHDFFSKSREEASRILTEHRLMLLLAWEAMCVAGLVQAGDRPSRLQGLPAGVYVGGGMRPSSVFAGSRDMYGKSASVLMASRPSGAAEILASTYGFKVRPSATCSFDCSVYPSAAALY